MMSRLSSIMNGIAGFVRLAMLLALASYGASANATGHTQRLDSDTQGSQFGYATATGDFNGDGYNDIAIGVPSYGLYSGSGTTDGRVHVYYGAAPGLQASADWIADSNQPGVGTYFGAAVVNVGDVNGDGIDDLAIGEPGDQSYTGAGHVYIFFGSTSGLKATGPMSGGKQLAIPTDADVTLGIGIGGDQFGAAMAGGDINQDGCSDIVVGAYGYDAPSDPTYPMSGGAAFVYRSTHSGACSLSTAPLEMLGINQSGASFGKAVALVTGIQGSVWPDLLIGANNFNNGALSGAGAAYVYYGSSSGTYPSSSDWTVQGDLAGGAVGTSVASVGDVNNDGYADIIIGAWAYNNTGAAFIYYGSASGLAGTGSAPVLASPADAGWQVSGGNSDGLGDSVVSAGDINGDGIPDVIVGGDLHHNTANPLGSNEGYAAVYYGSMGGPSSTTADWSFSPSGDAAIGAHYGGWVQPAGDVDGDGQDDYLVSAYSFSPSLANGSSPSPLNEGSVFVYLSRPAPGLVVTPSSGLTTTEAGGTASFTVALSVEPSADVTVQVATSDATEGTVSTGSLTFTGGAGGNWAVPQTVTVAGKDDFVMDGNITYNIIFTVSSSDSGYNGITTSPVTMTNNDNDVAGVTVSPTSGLVTEYNASASFTMVLTSQPSADVSFAISSSDTNQGTVSTGSVTFTTLNWNTPQTITVTGANPNPTNNVYSTIIGAASSTDPNYPNTIDPADVSVVNRLSTVTITATDASAAEPGTDTGTFTVTRDGSTSFALPVSYAVSGASTATSGVDYTALSGSVTIPAGQSSATITVTPINDSIIEPDETVVVGIATGSGYIADTATATVTIHDDDSQPTASFSADQTVAEGSTVTVSISLSHAAISYPVSIPYTVSGTATNPADHNAVNGVITINSGTTGSLSFTTVSDNIVEGNETVIFTMGTPTNATAGAQSSTVVTISDGGGSTSGGGGGGVMGLMLWLALLLKRRPRYCLRRVARLGSLAVLVVIGLVLNGCGGGGVSISLPGGGTSGSSKVYAIRGTVTGLSGTVLLKNNDGDDLSLSTNGGFTFSTNLADGASYDVTVFSDPTGQTCYVGNASGVINGANVTNVSVNCTTNSAVATYTVGGNISGLSGNIVLLNNGGDDLALSADGGFTFATAVVDGADYKVTASTPPAGQTCAVTSGSGTVNGAAVTSVMVSCGATLGTQTASRVAAGYKHTCAILGNGKVKCWGENGNGQLGLGDTLARGRDPGSMGDNLPAVDLGTGRAAVAIAAGAYHSCAILDNGTVKCWGSNASGQLGLAIDSANPNHGDAAGEMGDNLPAVNLGGLSATQITAGWRHSCALLSDGSVKCWGIDFFGEVGGNGTVNLGGHSATAISAGDAHTCALLDNFSVMCWGYNGYGQLGQGDTTNRGSGATVDLGAGRTALQVAAGTSYSCAILDDGSVKCWGGNYFGQLGLGDTTNRGDVVGQMGDNLPTLDLGSGRTATQIALGQQHACAILDNGSVKCWGYNIFGELGLGDSEKRGDGVNEMGDNLPVVNLGSGRTAVRITVGQAESFISGTDGTHSCAILDDNTLKCWGWNASGQLGIIDVFNDFALGNNPGEMGDSLQPVNLGN